MTANETLCLKAADGFELAAYLARPEQVRPRAALVMLPEIFGVNRHIRSVADRYAAHGYLVIVPQTFDRVERDLDLGYGEDDVKHGHALMRRLDWGEAVLDICAAADAVANAGRCAVLGYCWGGTAAWLAASRAADKFECAVSYYGNAIPTVMQDRPRIPMMLHWGERDHLISLAAINQVTAAVPDAVTHLYPCGHGFNCEPRTLYHAESAALAEARTLAFLAQHLA